MGPETTPPTTRSFCPTQRHIYAWETDMGPLVINPTYTLVGIYWVPLPKGLQQGRVKPPGRQFSLRSASPRRGVDRSTALFGRDTHGISGRVWGMVGWMVGKDESVRKIFPRKWGLKNGSGIFGGNNDGGNASIWRYRLSNVFPVEKKLGTSIFPACIHCNRSGGEYRFAPIKTRNILDFP